jgi:hypothetical protein
MMQRLSASLGTDGEALKCCAMLIIAAAMMWPQRHNGLLYWSLRSAFTLAVAMCFPRFRAAAAAVVTRSMTTLGLAGGVNREIANGRAAAAAAVGRARAAAKAGSAAVPGTSGIERHRPVDKWSWEDAGDAIRVTVQLPSASLDRNAQGAVVPPIAGARMMPQDFTLTITTSRAEHVLEVKNLFNAIDPRTSGATVDPATGSVTLRLEKWHDTTKWKTLVDEGKHPLASMELDPETSKANFEDGDEEPIGRPAGLKKNGSSDATAAFPIKLGGVRVKKA